MLMTATRLFLRVNTLGSTIHNGIGLTKFRYAIVATLGQFNGCHRNPQYTQSRERFTSAIVENSPRALQPYLNLIRFDKPIGTYLLFSPCSWSIAAAAGPGCVPDVGMLTLFGIGSFLMRGAGCVINDMWDKDFDKQVTRTTSRPLANNDVTFNQGLTYLAGLLSCSLCVLLQLNWYSVFLGGSSLLLVVLYPLMKRFTYWPQAMLGLTINWGALLGYSAVNGYCDWSICLPLYAASIMWTLIYDTIYAYQVFFSFLVPAPIRPYKDTKDDAIIGVKSTALLFGDDPTYWLTGFSSIMISSLLLSGYFAEQTFPYYLSVLLTSSHLLWQVYTLNTHSPDDCSAKFRSNRWIGVILFCGIALGNFLKTNNSDGRKSHINECA